MKTYLWTALKSRLKFIKSTPGINVNWLFLPGGPGLGSESLAMLTEILDLPGTIWHLDLPGDGSNITDNNSRAFSHWSAALIEAVSAFENVILVGHSTGGMYAQAIPELAPLLKGLVLMDSAPNTSWQQAFMEYVTQHPLPELEDLQKRYTVNPNNDLLKQLTVAAAPYLFTPAALKKGAGMLAELPINFESCEWSAQNFDSTYQAKWIPNNIPTLIFAGQEDYLTPLNLFADLAEYQHKNILIQQINHAGHYPWLDNPAEVVKVFKEYSHQLKNKVYTSN